MSIFAMLFAGALFVVAIPVGAILGMLLIGLPLSRLARGERLGKALGYLGAVTGVILMWWMLSDTVRGWAASSGASSQSIDEPDENRWIRP